MPTTINDGVQKLIRDLKANGLWAAIAAEFYEAAAYTPTYLGLTSAGVTTYITQEGFYVRVGAVVHTWVNLNWSAASGTGDAIISLPFTAGSLVALYPGTIRYNSVTWTGSDPQIVVNAGTAYARMQGVSSNAAPTLTAVEAAGAIAAYVPYLVS